MTGHQDLALGQRLPHHLALISHTAGKSATLLPSVTVFSFWVPLAISFPLKGRWNKRHEQIGRWKQRLKGQYANWNKRLEGHLN
jgi:hypothetical protein